MFGFIRSSSFATQAMVPIIGLILFGIAWFLPAHLQPGALYGNGYFYLPADGWMYTSWQSMSHFPLWAQIAPSFLIAMISAGLLVQMDMNHLLTGQRTYAMAFVFFFLLTSGGYVFLFHPAMVAGLCMVLSNKFLLDLYTEEYKYSLVLAMGFCWGVAVVLYPPSSFMIPAFLTGLLFMVATNWRHWLVVLSGVLIPIVLTGAAWYLVGDLDYEITTFLSWFQFRTADFIPEFINKEPFIAIWLAVMLVWAMIASAKYRNPKIQSRILYQANFLLFVSTLITIVIVRTVSVEMIWILVIPLSYLMTFWSLKVARWWKRDLFFISMLLFFVFFRIQGLI